MILKKSMDFFELNKIIDFDVFVSVFFLHVLKSSQITSYFEGFL